MISIEEARRLVLSECRPLEAECRRLIEALGHVLAEAIVAPRAVPAFDNSAMDGFALRADDAVLACPEQPGRFDVIEVVPAGHVPTRAVGQHEAAKIMTGAPVPQGADTVIPWEEVVEEDGALLVTRAPVRGAHVRYAGEDMAAGDVVLEAGDIVGPPEIGMLASLGVQAVQVHRMPRVAILSTGSELVELGGEVTPGKIFNSNSYTADAQCRVLGLSPVRLGIVPDEFEETLALMRKGLDYDVLITSGGVSVGEFDFVKEVQESLGVERRLWRVAMKPGKPLVFGVHGKTLVFGVPGNPGAAMISFELFIRPALLRLMGRRQVVRPVWEAVLDEDLPNKGDRARVLRAVVSRVDGEWHAVSAGYQGSGVLRTMARANALIFIPTEGGGRRQGEAADFVLLKEELKEP